MVACCRGLRFDKSRVCGLTCGKKPCHKLEALRVTKQGQPLFCNLPPLPSPPPPPSSNPFPTPSPPRDLHFPLPRYSPPPPRPPRSRDSPPQPLFPLFIPPPLDLPILPPPPSPLPPTSTPVPTRVRPPQTIYEGENIARGDSPPQCTFPAFPGRLDCWRRSPCLSSAHSKVCSRAPCPPRRWTRGGCRRSVGWV